MELKRAKVIASNIAGFTLLIIGGFLIGLYILEGIIEPWGKADQSMAFWALPILFIGTFSFTIGALLVWIAQKRELNG